jgi:hypothetical protein
MCKCSCKRSDSPRHLAHSVDRVTAHDVVAITLRGIVYYLARHPEVQKKLQKEIIDMAEAGKLSNPSQYSEITTMSYV